MKRSMKISDFLYGAVNDPELQALVNNMDEVTVMIEMACGQLDGV
jgi:hypothetical protein